MPAPLWETGFYPDGVKNGFGGVQGRGVERSWIQGLSIYDAHAATWGCLVITVKKTYLKRVAAPAGGDAFALIAPRAPDQAG